jgi:hypothetical protein
MQCPHCSTPHAVAARFCARCGTPLHPHIDRDAHYAAQPDEPVRALALLSTLLPHISGKRHHLYRNSLLLAMLASAVAAAFGVLSVALICAAIALPVIVLTYLHDHDVWRDEPLTVIGGGFVLALALGISIGLLDQHWAAGSLLAATRHALPSGPHILELGIVVPLLVALGLVLAPLAVTSRPAFRHPLDAVNLSSLSGAALSLGMSVVVQHGAFSQAAGAHTDPERTFFIAMTLGAVQPVLFATAAALIVLRVRRTGGNLLLGAAEGIALVLAYELVTELLSPYGSRGVVLTALVAVVLAAAGVLLVRVELHDALLGEARAALAGAGVIERAATAGQQCAHCGVEFGARAAFCQVCGTAVASQPVPRTRTGGAGVLAPSAA